MSRPRHRQICPRSRARVLIATFRRVRVLIAVSLVAVFSFTVVVHGHTHSDDHVTVGHDAQACAFCAQSILLDAAPPRLPPVLIVVTQLVAVADLPAAQCWCPAHRARGPPCSRSA